LQEREAELVRIQRIARVGGLEIDSATASGNRRSPEYLLVHGLPPMRANETYEDWVTRHPEDREQTVSHLFDTLKGESEDYSAVYRIVRPDDGEVRWIRVAAKIDRNREGHALRLVGADLDVTDQMLAQATLRESEERFRLIANSAPVPMWVTKMDRTRLFANQSYLDFVGLPYEAIRSTGCYASGRPAAPCRIGRGRNLETLRAGAPRRATTNGGCDRDRRRAGTDRQAHQLYRRRARHHRGQAGRDRSSPDERNPRATYRGTNGAA
jgi:PAS domain-containing protein